MARAASLDLIPLRDASLRGDGELLSDTRRSRVLRLPHPTGDVVVKEIHLRRGLRGLRERLRRRIGRSRARAADHAATRLWLAGVRVPEPLGRLEHEGRSLLFSRWVPGAPLEVLDVDRWAELLVPVAALVGRLHAQVAVHGDLQPKNVLVAEDGSLTLLDVDRARFPRSVGARDRARDLGPLLAGAAIRGLDPALRERAWAGYLREAGIPDSPRLRAVILRRVARLGARGNPGAARGVDGIR